MSHSDESEVNVSAELHTPVVKARRKRKTDPAEDNELPVFGNIGTPIPTGTPMVNVDDEVEWEDWKKEELAKAGKNANAKRRLPFEPGSLPEKSDSKHYPDRKVYKLATRNARKELIRGLDAINQRGLNVADDDEINIQINGKNLSKPLCKKFQKALKKDMKKMGNPKKTEDIFSEDEDDKEFNKRWAPEREKMMDDWSEIMERENENRFDPLDEYMFVMGDDTGEKTTSEGYLKWLKEKVNQGAISWKYTYYEQEYRRMKKREGFKGTTKRKFKKLVQNVQDYYKDHNH